MGTKRATCEPTGQQVTASYSGYSLQQSYDGNGLRVKKTENGATTYYLRSMIFGGSVAAEIVWNGSSWSWNRGYVYSGSGLLAVQSGAAVSWVHEDPVTKSKRITNSSGAIISSIELDPWGADAGAAWSSNSAFQPRKFTTYDRDGNGSDEAMFRRHNRWHSRFDQPDPYDGSYDLTNPQSINRYAYVQNDPVNFVDPSGLQPCGPENRGVECGWQSVAAGFWGAGNLNNRPHTRDWALENKPPALQCPPGHICFLQPVSDRRYILHDFGPQPMPSLVDIIVSKNRRDEELKRLQNEARQYFDDCVDKDPAYQRYAQAASKPSSPLPIPGALGIGKISFRTITGVRAGLSVGAALATRANVFTLAASSAFNVLLYSPPGSSEYNAAKPAIARCLTEALSKFGVASLYRTP